MNKTIRIVAIGAALSIVSALLGAGAAIYHLAKPFEQWGIEFNETFIAQQVEALRSLRQGNSEPAHRYLEVLAVIHLERLAKAKQNGSRAPLIFAKTEAIEYLCSNPPVMASPFSGPPPSIKESCALLLSH
jgi:hypothetical protein